MKKQLAKTVQEDLEKKILLNRFRPGEMVSEEELAKQYHVSRTPIRQALQQLAARGLVEIRDGAGSFVTGVSCEQMNDAYEIRCEMEKLALRSSIERIGEAELRPLEEAFKSYLALLLQGAALPLDELAFTDWQLHDLIVNRSENRLIGPTAEKITLILRRYQFANRSDYERATREHLAIIDGIRRRDLGGVCALLDEHLRLRQPHSA